jgi:serine/threonine-protein kinase HipA
MPAQVADVLLWGETIAAVSWDEQRRLAAFEYTPHFQRSGIELAPRMMPLGSTIYTFPDLAFQTYSGLPGLLADSLPDKFGNLLINNWLVRQGRDPAAFSPVERLCYIGKRGMGALEFKPSIFDGRGGSQPVDVAELVQLASEAIQQKEKLGTKFTGDRRDDLEAMRQILLVGTSAGGARAKAVIAWNEQTGEVRSGQVPAPEGYGYWLLKFDGISGNSDKELSDPQGYGKIEFAYYGMALETGIEMTRCRILAENGRHHFMTERFDRGSKGEKIFMQSLCALGHYDFNLAGAYSYEQAVQMAVALGCDKDAREQLFRRAVFNIMARNQDDHTKNIAFLMDKSGNWKLAPAFDLNYSYNPAGRWTNRHQMSLNGKQDGFHFDDFRQAAKRFQLFRGKRLDSLVEQIDSTLARWPEFAARAGVEEKRITAIAATFRRLEVLRRASGTEE